MRPHLLILAPLFLFFRANAQTSDTARIAGIEPDSIALAPLIYLASDELQGRHIGGAGIDIAASYIVAQLKKAGARPVPPYRPVPVIGTRPASVTTAYYQVFTRILSRFDFRKVGQDIKYNVPGFEPTKNFTLKNIVAYIPGTDPILRRQYIMLSAHYDHIGIADAPIEVDGRQDSIFNGARDNATGTAAVIAAARYFENIHQKDLYSSFFSPPRKKESSGVTTIQLIQSCHSTKPSSTSTSTTPATTRPMPSAFLVLALPTWIL